MSRVSERLRQGSPKPMVSVANDDEVRSAGSEVNELDEDEYEKERMENIKNNADLLASLGLSSIPSVRPHDLSGRTKKPRLSEREERLKHDRDRQPKRRRMVLEPTRRSGRVAAMATGDEGRSLPDYSDDKPMSTYTSSSAETKLAIPKSRAPVIPSGPEYEVDESGEEGTAQAPRPTREADGTLVFEGRWKGVFKPNVTPQEMFDGGAFGGGFFTDTYSQILKTPLPSSEAIASLPFTPDPTHVRGRYTNPLPEGENNRFKVRAGQSLQEWEKAGWVWSGDPRGWAEWYTRFWGGRRCVDDERQVRRWLKVAGPTGRFKRSLLKKVHLSGGEPALADEDVGAVLRQCLWQWGYELTPSEYERAMRGDE